MLRSRLLGCRLLVARSPRDPHQPLILRLRSIRAAKPRDNLRFGAHEDIPIYAPSIAANFLYVLASTYAITVDHATYAFAIKAYPILASRIAKLYPLYGFVVGERESAREWQMPEVVERGDYVLGFTALSKTGPYLKFEAKPHAAIFCPP